MPDETGGPYPGDGSNGPNVLDDSMEGAAVYLWHCNRDGQYSLYPQGVSDENYLRGQIVRTLTDRASRGGLQRGLRDDGLRASVQQLRLDVLPKDSVFGNDGGIYHWPRHRERHRRLHRQPDHRRLTGRRQFGENRADG